MKGRVDGTKVITGEVRFDYPHILKKRIMEEGKEGKYSLCILIDKDDSSTVKAINAAIEKAKEDGRKFWGDEIPEDLKIPLRDGDLDRSDLVDYKNQFFINASTKRKPGVVDRDLIIITDEEEIYSGCYGRVSINFFPYSRNGNEGIACGLVNIQKLCDGPSIGGQAAAENDFSF